MLTTRQIVLMAFIITASGIVGFVLDIGFHVNFPPLYWFLGGAGMLFADMVARS